MEAKSVISRMEEDNQYLQRDVEREKLMVRVDCFCQRNLLHQCRTITSNDVLLQVIAVLLLVITKIVL